MPPIESMIECSEKVIQALRRRGIDNTIVFVQDYLMQSVEYQDNKSQRNIKEIHDCGLAIWSRHEKKAGEISIPLDVALQKGYDWVAEKIIQSSQFNDYLKFELGDESPVESWVEKDIPQLDTQELISNLDTLDSALKSLDRVIQSQIQIHRETIVVKRSDDVLRVGRRGLIHGSTFIESYSGGVGYADSWKTNLDQFDFTQIGMEAKSKAESNFLQRPVTNSIRTQICSLPIIWDYRAIASLVSFVLLPALLERNDYLTQLQGKRLF